MAAYEIRVENLSVAYWEKPILQNVSFTVRKGQTLAIVGESGGGKTTLAKILCGLVDETEGLRCSGRVCVGGVDILAATPAQLRHYRGRDVGLIVQALSDALNPHLTMLQHIKEMQAQHHIKTADARALCERYNLPSHLYHRYPFQLSGGEIQRLLTALALMNNPSCLILDEPTASLDDVNKERAIRSFQIGQEGRAQILITHDLNLARRMANDMGILRAGALIELGAAKDIFDSPKEVYSRALIQKNQSVYKLPIAEPDLGALPAQLTEKEHGLQITGLSHSYDGKQVFRNISAFVPKGQCLVVLGSSGCGKSTMARLIANYQPLQSGQLCWQNGNSPPLLPSCCLISQHPQRALARHFSVEDVLNEAIELNKKTPRKVGLIDRLKRKRQGCSDANRKQIRKLLDRVELPFDEDFLQRKTGKLSGGEAQRLVIARALVSNPDVIVADEPTSALDLVSSRQIIHLLNQVKKTQRVSLIVFTHDLSVAHQLSDQCRQMTRDGLEHVSLQTL